MRKFTQYERYENTKLIKGILQLKIDSPTLQSKTVNNFVNRTKNVQMDVRKSYGRKSLRCHSGSQIGLQAA